MALPSLFVCSTCNTNIHVKHADSRGVVCPKCLEFHKGGASFWVNMGNADPMPEDMSLLRIGTKGKLDDNEFELIGRRKIVFENGTYRNDWLALSANYSIFFIYESRGEYVVIDSKVHVIKYKEISDLHTYKSFRVPLIEKKVTVESILKYQSEYLEGEFPEEKEIVKGFYTLELCNSSKEVVFVNVYSKQDVTIVNGRWVELEAFNFSNLRTADEWN